MGRNGQALAKSRPQQQSTALAPQSLDDMFRLAGALMKARGMIPERIKSEGELVATVLAGQELGLGPMASLRGIHVVKGKVGLNYDLMVGLLRRAGYRVEWPIASDTEACVKLTAPSGDVHEESFTRADAERAELWNSGMGWKKYPKAMLKARAISAAARGFAGDVLHGAYSMDEIQEIGGNTHSPREDFDHGTADEQARKRKEAADIAQAWLADLDAIETEDQLAAWLEHNRDTLDGLNNRYQQNEYTKVWRRLVKAASRAGVSQDDLRALVRGETVIDTTGEPVEEAGEVSYEASWRDEPLAFGKKHTDTPLRKVPSGYLRWMAESVKDAQARQKAEAELEVRDAEKSRMEQQSLETGDDPWGLDGGDAAAE